MNDTWAGILAISVAVMALVQVVVLAALGFVAMKLIAVAQSTQQQVESLAADVKGRIATVAERVNAVTERISGVAEDVRGVTARIQQVATTVSEGVQRMDQSVRAAGQRVAHTIDQVPGPVKKGVPAGLAILAAIRTVQQVRARMRSGRTEESYSDPQIYAST